MAAYRPRVKETDFCVTKANLSHGITKAKQQHTKKDTWITNVHYSPVTAMFLYFFACSDAVNDILSSASLKKSLSKINPCKAAGPDNVPLELEIRKC